MAKNVTRRRFMTYTGGVLAGGLGLGACRSAGLGRARGPNVVVILADDLGYGDLGCYGCPDIRTPNVDSIAAEGVRFTSFYANAPECTPTRTALLTGRYQHRVGGLECALGIGNVGRYDDAIRLRETHDMGLPASEPSIARMLKSAGYVTGISGKWHLGYEPKFFPANHGFDHWFGPIGGAVDYFHHCEYTGEPGLYLNDRPVERKGYLTDLITQDAVEFVRRHRRHPFFLYVAYTAPHTPYQGPEDETPDPIPEDKYNQGTRDTYREMVERMDAGVGAILEALQQGGLARDTLVIFMSDNGGTKIGRNEPFSGYKGNVFEGGIRVPCAARWPGVLPPGVVSDQPCMTMDFSRSIVRAAGAEPACSFDGIDILHLAQTGAPVRSRTLFWRIRRGNWTRKAVRSGDMKYIALDNGESVQEHLFDLAADPQERKDLLSDRADGVRQLKRLLDDWEGEVRSGR